MPPRMYGGNGTAPALSIALRKSAPLLSKASTTEPSSCFVATVAASPLKLSTSPMCMRLVGRAKQSQRPAPRSRIRRTSALPPVFRSPISRAGMTLVSLNTSRSPSSSRPGRSRTVQSCNASPETSSKRALSRGDVGRWAISSAGSTKSKRSTRIQLRRTDIHHVGIGIVTGRLAVRIDQRHEAMDTVHDDALHALAGLEAVEMRQGLAEGENDL